jgi:hypothetical protein
MNVSSHKPLRSSSCPAPMLLVRLAALAAFTGPVFASVTTTPTMDPQALAEALRPSVLNIISVSIHNGVAGQFGTYENFELAPVTIRPGIVLSSGDVTNLEPIPGATDPEYDPASPPAQVNNQMVPEPDSGGTAEFDEYGMTAGNIENFTASYRRQPDQVRLCLRLSRIPVLDRPVHRFVRRVSRRLRAGEPDHL